MHPIEKHLLNRLMVQEKAIWSKDSLSYCFNSMEQVLSIASVSFGIINEDQKKISLHSKNETIRNMLSAGIMIEEWTRYLDGELIFAGFITSVLNKQYEVAFVPIEHLRVIHLALFRRTNNSAKGQAREALQEFVQIIKEHCPHIRAIQLKPMQDSHSLQVYSIENPLNEAALRRFYKSFGAIPIDRFDKEGNQWVEIVI